VAFLVRHFGTDGEHDTNSSHWIVDTAHGYDDVACETAADQFDVAHRRPMAREDARILEAEGHRHLVDAGSNRTAQEAPEMIPMEFLLRVGFLFRVGCLRTRGCAGQQQQERGGRKRREDASDSHEYYPFIG
jgi:hypothetical protein